MRLYKKYSLRFNCAIRPETLGKRKPISEVACFLWMALVLCAVSACAEVSLPVINTSNVVNITSAPYGAVGDGVTTNTAAIQAAINAAAAGGTTNGLSGGTVEIPAPGIYLCGPITLQNNVNLQIDAGATLQMLPFGEYPVTWYTNGSDVYFIANNNFISGSNLHDIEISGSGSIDGQGEPWWPWAYTNGAVRPIMIRLSDCDRELIQNVTLSNSPMFHISISGSRAANTTVRSVTIRAPSSSANPPSHNTDACDVDGTNILVENCNISVGDDDFTCGGGTSDVLLTNNTYGTGHGVSIGSYTDGGVSNITVINCTFDGTENGVRIKSDDGRGGLVQNIHYYNLGMINVHFPIQIYAYYNEVGTPSGITPAVAAAQPVASVTSTTPIYRDITFSNITATSVSGYPIGLIWARTEAPATNIVFDKVNITGDRNFCLYNVNGAKFIDCNLHPSSSTTTFAMFNAQAVITNSASPGQLFTFDGLTTNGYGNSLALYNAQGSLKNTNAFGSGPLTLSASTFTVSNNLSLLPNTVLNFTLGANAATLAVVGNLMLGGTVNLAAGNGFGIGTYTIMTYTGILGGSLPALGTVPAGYTYSFDTNTIGQVKLTVAPVATQPPPAPTNLVATAGSNSVTLTWSPATTATRYNVKRALVSGGENTTNAIVGSTRYTDTQVTNGTTYYYVVSAVNAIGESPDSAEVSTTPRKPTFIVVTTNVFADDFSGSTLNSTSPTAPTPAGTSYETLSSKTWNPTPSIGAGHLEFGINATSSGVIEEQARFANPVTLASIGDSVSLVVAFTNTAGLLTGSGAMGFGLYQSGQNFPVPGGLNGTATTGSSANAIGNAQTWVGYVGQIADTGGDCQIMTRPAQTIGTLYNNDEDLVTSGSGSSSYIYPSGATVGTASSAPSVTLAAGDPYTDVLSIMLTATNVLVITNSLYSGTGTNGLLLSQFGGVASGATYLTNTFDALAVGWRETGSQPTAMDINRIAVNASSMVTLTNSVALNSTNLVFQVIGNQLELSWPGNHLGWTLQTNAVALAATNAWFAYPGSASVTNVNIPINATTTNVFFRLIYYP
jgi:polygalacturonase